MDEGFLSSCYHSLMSSHKPKLILLDANALLHRAWHAIPMHFTSPQGIVVNAVYGIASVVLKIMKDEKPDVFIACWDTAAKTFRHEAYTEYKAHRPEKEQELYDQIPIAKEVLETMGIPSLAMDGYEADDLIGTLSRMGAKRGYHVRIVTGDRDSLQLITDDVDVLTFKKGVSDTKIYDAAAVKEEYGIDPIQTIDWKAISGDASDNIKGIKGIGEKGASDLVHRFGSLEGVVKAAKDPSSELTPSLRKKILEGEKDGLFSKKLVTVDCSVPIKVSFESLQGTLNRDAFVEVAAKYGFKSLIARLAVQGSADLPDGRKGEERGVSGKRQKHHEKEDFYQKFDDKQEAIDFLKECQKKEEIVVYIEVGAQGSLFGDSLQGVILGDDIRSGFISASLLHEKEVMSVLKKILGAEQPRKICHDAKAVMKFLEQLDIPILGISHDILLAAYLLAAGERQTDLDVIAAQELGTPLPASEDAKRPLVVKTIWDVCEKQRMRMKEEKVDWVMSEIELPLVPILREMERIGILLDVSYLKKLSKEVTEARSKLEKEMFELVGHEFNPASPSQLSRLFFEELELSTKGIKKGKTGFSTAASELEKLEGLHPVVRLIGRHREVSKLLSTYIETLPLLVDAGGRVHTTFNQAIAATGRLSSSDPNLQNIPVRTELGRQIRRAFIASPGMQLLSCDYSQIELRIAAALSKDKKLLDVFESGKDVHAATAAEIWNIPLEAVTKEQRRAAKAINFGILFGQGPQGLSKSAEIPYAEAKEFIDRYFETFKGIKLYLEETKIMARANGYVETLFGRRRPIPDIVSGIPAVRAAAERMAINMPIQGTEADLIKLAMIEISKKLSATCPKARMLLQVHDELVFEVPEKEVRKVASFAQKTMAEIREIGCPIVVDAKAGLNWEEMDVLE
jgi:DNA polymerase-1